MALFNTFKKFGLLTRLFHWITFILFVTQFFLVYRKDYFSEGAPEKLQYMLLHKSIGIVLLAIAILFFLVHFIGSRPPFPRNMTNQEKLLAKFTHHVLWLSMFAMPVTGIAMSMYSGYGASLFGLYQLPNLVSTNKELAGSLHQIHGWISYIVIGAVFLHVLGALIHHFIRKDDVLKKML